MSINYTLSAIPNSEEPKKIEIEDGEVIGQKQTLQFDFTDDEEPVLIVGEDTENEITESSIYAALYWGEVVKLNERMSIGIY